MDFITMLLAILTAALISDILLKAADALYALHLNLLIRPIHTRPSLRRYASVYLLTAGTSGLLLRSPCPLVFISAWLPSLFIILIILTDYEQQLIFDRVLIGLALTVLFLSPWIEAYLINRIAAALLGGGIMLALSILSRGGIGGGDIKLLFVLGLWQGIDALLFILTFGFVSGGLAAALLLLTRKKKKRDFFAYGPYFAFGSLLTLL